MLVFSPLILSLQFEFCQMYSKKIKKNCVCFGSICTKNGTKDKFQHSEKFSHTPMLHVRQHCCDLQLKWTF